MGSSSSSQTAQTSIAPTVQDNDNPLVIAGSRNDLSTSMIDGALTLGKNASFNILDGGAVAAGLSLGEKSITALADLTAKLVAASSSSNVAALGFAGTQAQAAYDAANPDAAAEKRTNWTLWVVCGVVALGLYFKYGRGK